MKTDFDLVQLSLEKGNVLAEMSVNFHVYSFSGGFRSLYGDADRSLHRKSEVSRTTLQSYLKSLTKKCLLVFGAF